MKIYIDYYKYSMRNMKKIEGINSADKTSDDRIINDEEDSECEDEEYNNTLSTIDQAIFRQVGLGIWFV